MHITSIYNQNHPEDSAILRGEAAISYHARNVDNNILVRNFDIILYTSHTPSTIIKRLRKLDTGYINYKLHADKSIRMSADHKPDVYLTICNEPEPVDDKLFIAKDKGKVISTKECYEELENLIYNTKLDIEYLESSTFESVFSSKRTLITKDKLSQESTLRSECDLYSKDEIVKRLKEINNIYSVNIREAEMYAVKELKRRRNQEQQVRTKLVRYEYNLLALDKAAINI